MVMINKERFLSQGDIITSMGGVGMRLNDLENYIADIYPFTLKNTSAFKSSHKTLDSSANSLHLQQTKRRLFLLAALRKSVLLEMTSL